MEYGHLPVLPAEVTQQLRCRRGSRIVDCTLGGAGHAEAILKIISPDGMLIGIDRDQAAIDAATERLASFSRQIFLARARFSDLDRVLRDAGVLKVDGFLFDLGVSSAQLDVPGRGFSYQRDEPLDMRMDSSLSLTAEKVLNEYTAVRLAEIISRYGEEKWAARIAEFVVKRRSSKPIRTTGELVQVIKDAVPAAARKGGMHPARRTFQALRIEVNGELMEVEQALDDCYKWLEKRGRIVVISYHSLEDRIVKNKFKSLAAGCVCPPHMPVCVCGRTPLLAIVNRKPIRPSADETAGNPRSRSAKMRVAERV